ncbi:hypothetical protein N8221_00075 [Flavobacteriaceae bacterium]|nr:hypothetical protein [Flavobacteriaceae bacterium]
MDQNAKWFSERRENKSYSLNYDTFKSKQKKNDKLKLKKNLIRLKIIIII